ncbi:MAG: hypothetical protein Q3960_02320 [Lactobacillus sp.]|nr:hypothetical protein [Lactobacillus sp.]
MKKFRFLQLALVLLASVSMTTSVVSASASFPKKGTLGNAGKASIPRKFQGVWYGKYGKIVLNKSIYQSFPYNKKSKPETSFLLKMKKLPSDFHNPSKKHLKLARNWIRSYYDSQLNAVNFLGWYQISGFGETYYYRTVTIKKRKLHVLLETPGGDPYAKVYYNVYFRTPGDAKKYQNISVKGMQRP